MTEEIDNPPVYCFISYPIQKVVSFLLSVTPQLLLVLLRLVFGVVQVVLGLILSVVRYAAHFFSNKLDDDPEFKEKLQKIPENEKLRNTGERLRKSGVFKWIASFLYAVFRSIIEGGKRGYTEYQETLEMEKKTEDEEDGERQISSLARSRRRRALVFWCVVIVVIGVHEIVVKDAGDVKTVEIAGIKTRFRWCPPGNFMMGSPESEEGRFNDETQHKVKLTRGFWLCEVPVTVEAFQKFVDDAGYETEAEKNNDTQTWKKTGVVEQTPLHPAIYVSWNDAQAYIKWLNENYAPKGLTFKLPSEAHWEYACRSGSKTAYWWGNSIEKGKGKINLADATFKEMLAENDPDTLKTFEEKGWTIVSFHDGYSFTNPVDATDSNDWGIKDMLGNVWEWNEDWYGGYPQDLLKDSTGPTEGSQRVIRGGCWFNTPIICRSARRVGCAPESRDKNVGFRLELSEPSTSTHNE